MHSIKRVFLFGFLLWLLPFLFAFLIYPLKTSHPPFFETLMPVFLTLCIMFFSILYFKATHKGFIKEGILIGIIWLVISIIIDLFMFSRGPMKMSFGDYMMDIGLTYLIYPIVTIGLGIMIEKKRGEK